MQSQSGKNQQSNQQRSNQALLLLSIRWLSPIRTRWTDQGHLLQSELAFLSLAPQCAPNDELCDAALHKKCFLGFATGYEARLCLAVRLGLRVGYAPRSGSAHQVLWAKAEPGATPVGLHH